MTPTQNAPSSFDFSNSARAGSPRQWWPGGLRGKIDEPGQAMVDTAQAIEVSSQEQQRQDLNLLYGSMYEGRQLNSLYQYGGQAAISADGVPTIGGEVTWNVVRSVVQTVASQVSRTRPRARFLTSGGTRKQANKAKKLTKYCDGLFAAIRVYEVTQQAFLDAGWGDVAGIEIFRDDDRVGIGRVLCNEILIDGNDGVRGKPRCMYRRKFIDKDVALAQWGTLKKADDGTQVPANDLTAAILNAKAADPTHNGISSNLIELYEGWHLRSGRKAKDGRHTIAVDGPGGTIVDEEYKWDYFPIILFALDPPAVGSYGVSAAQTLLPIQLAINTGLDKIARAQHLAAVPRVGMPMSAKVAQMPNGIGSIIRFQGTQPPVFWSPQALSPEVYEQLERHFEKAFSLYGVNAQVAAGQKEAGLTAAVAIRESLDIQTARFSVLAQRWEQLHMDVARRAIDISKDIYQDHHDLEVSAPGTALLETIPWTDVDMEEDEYVIQPYPASLLPTTPQGRLDRVTDLVSEGIWSAKRGEAALDDMDPDAHEDLELAGERDIERICEAMLDDGKYEGPEPTMDLDACLRIGSQYLSDGRNRKLPPKRVDLLYRFLDDVTALKGLIGASPGPSPGGPPAPGAQPAQPAAPAQAAA